MIVSVLPAERRPISRVHLAVLVVLAVIGPAVPAHGQDVPAGTSSLTFPAWWSQPGGPAWRPDAALAGGMPWNFAGLTAGAWELRDPFGPTARIAAGLPEAQAPLAWYDSAAVTVGEGAAWRGFGAGLAVAQGFVRPLAGRTPRAVFTTITGADAVDRDGILLMRGDEHSWLRAGSTGNRRGGIGALDLAGDHLWSLQAGTRRGNSVFDVAFTQRGMGERQRNGGNGVSEGGAGQGVAWGWSWTRAGDSLAVRASRGFDGRNVVPIVYGDPSLRRDAEGKELEVAAARRRGDTRWGVRLDLLDQRVMQHRMEFDGSGQWLEWSTRSWWLAGRHARPWQGGDLVAELGGGFDRSSALRHERAQLAPSVSWRVRQGGNRLRVFAERIVDPVWSDLDGLTAPFVQDTWAGGFDASAADSAGHRAGVLLLGGRTGNRATVLRYPIRGIGEEIGVQRDVRPYRFLLLQGTAASRFGPLATDASAWALARPVPDSQPRVDPGVGGTLGAEGRFRAFAGDLGVRLRLEGDYVGPRVTDTRAVTDLGTPIPDVTLAGYVTYSVVAALTLGDATITIRGTHLESAVHPGTWIDPAVVTGYTLAAGAGRQFMLELVWPLFN